MSAAVSIWYSICFTLNKYEIKQQQILTFQLWAYQFFFVGGGGGIAPSLPRSHVKFQMPTVSFSNIFSYANF